MKRYVHMLVCVACFLSLAAVAQAAPGGLAGAKQRMQGRLGELASLKRDKKVGENRVGMLEVLGAGKADAAVQRLDNEENADRGAVYAAIARKTNSDAEHVGRKRASQIFKSAAPGVMLQRDDGSWSEKR